MSALVSRLSTARISFEMSPRSVGIRASSALSIRTWCLADGDACNRMGTSVQPYGYERVAVWVRACNRMGTSLQPCEVGRACNRMRMGPYYGICSQGCWPMARLALSSSMISVMVHYIVHYIVHYTVHYTVLALSSSMISVSLAGRSKSSTALGSSTCPRRGGGGAARTQRVAARPHGAAAWTPSEGRGHTAPQGAMRGAMQCTYGAHVGAAGCYAMHMHMCGARWCC